MTSADSDGGGRSVVACDFNGDGAEDLLVRQTGGGALLHFESRFARAHWLAVSLRGVKSNTQGIGARVTVHAGETRIVRELYPVNGFRARGPAHVHFGPGSQAVVSRLTVRWPSGLVQDFSDVAADAHTLITEGEANTATRP